jgi:hypothetical protein
MNRFTIRISLLAATLAGFCTLAHAEPNNMNRGVESDGMLALKRNRSIASDGSSTIKIVMVMKSVGEVAGVEQNCKDGKVSPSPKITTYTTVGFDEKGIARVTSTNLEIKDCRGIKGPEVLHYIGNKQESVPQELSESKAHNLNRMLGFTESSPKDCPTTIKVSAFGKIVDMKGCEDQGG